MESNDLKDFTAARRTVRSTRALASAGIDPPDVRTAVRRGALRRVRRGWYVDEPEWSSAHTEQRHLMQVVAAAESARGADMVFVRTAAAVLWSCPLWRCAPKNVHAAGAGGDGSATTSGPVARHRVVIPAADRAERFGIPCTSLERTVVDVACTASIETALACADAAMRRVAWDPVAREYDFAAAEAFRERLREVLRRRAGARGIRRARFVVDFADGRAESPLESTSRLYFHVLGFDPPPLQTPIPGPNGERYRVEFDLAPFNAWGECDGKGKYHDLSRNGGRTPAQVFDDEKRREDWIRGTTRRWFLRWGARELDSVDTFEAFLRSRGIVSGRPRRILPA
ncbi:hypothetical protein [Microbacterium sp.]|uniref:hypothetical protein n=1 Tax=Microbacterium sp. TaxID=51671 RepID=UPI0039E5B9D2